MTPETAEAVERLSGMANTGGGLFFRLPAQAVADLRLVLAAISSPSGVGREEIARVIEPEAWAYFDTDAGQHSTADLLRHNAWKQSALAKADDILALLPAALRPDPPPEQGEET